MPPEPRENPPRRLSPLTWIVFRPWSWNTWLFIILIAIAPVGYVLSSNPVKRVLRQKCNAPELHAIAITVYRPVGEFAYTSETMMAIFRLQDEIMDRFLGPEPPICGMGLPYPDEDRDLDLPDDSVKE